MPKRKKETVEVLKASRLGKYELLLIVHPEVEVKEAVSEVEALINKESGKVLETTFWDKRPLTYPIKKQTAGNFVLFVVELPKESRLNLHSALRLNEKILRSLWIAL